MAVGHNGSNGEIFDIDEGALDMFCLSWIIR